MNFTATDVLREVKFGNFRGSKTIIVVILEALNFDFRDNFTFQSVENSQIFTFETHTFYVKSHLTISRRSKTTILVSLEVLILIFGENSTIKSVPNSQIFTL